MKNIEYKLLVKFLKLFIKCTDLTEDADKQLFETLKIINNNPPVEL